MQPETTLDEKRQRLISTIVYMENEARIAEDELERIREQLQSQEAIARDLRETLLGLNRQLERLERPNPDHLFLLPAPPTTITPIEPSFAPRREEGIMVILNREPDRIWTYAELDEEFRRRGWDNPKAKKEMAAIRAAIYRLNRLGRVELGPERGEFRLKMPPATSAPDTGGSSP